ncbi:MAG: hypothetical protein WC523_00350 [Patescibacteria group bacterium]
MKCINICLEVWAVGGAEIGYKRVATKLNNYKWLFTNKVSESADLVIYSNSNKFYDQAKRLNIPVIQRMTGPRSYQLKQPNDLSAVICSSLSGWNASTHSKKNLIYNGVDIEYINKISPIFSDILYAPARIGLGQEVELAIKYAKYNNRNITVLGSRQHVAEDTYGILKKRYPWVNWTGLVDVDVASAYIKGCNSYICPTKTHGVSNAIIEAVAHGKEIINLGNVEIPPKDQIDINITAEKYNNLIKTILKLK